SSKIDTEQKKNNINFLNNNKEALNTNTSNKNFAAVNSKGIELNLNLEGFDSQKSNDLNSINNNLLKNILDMKSNNFNQRLAEIFERNIKMGHNKFEIEIKPENLGKIEISLDIHGDKVDINMKVDNNTVANLITEGSSSLQKSFNSQGLNLGNLNLNFNNQNKFGEDNLKKEKKNDKNKATNEDESLDLKIEKHYKDNNIVYIKA
ncbi:MAG: flagellar hook-length control protein FliK, partial [Pseudomonadota bacterium]|nr:flagellar hook-length control protein FliK [Pseudomonadota bacterium]